MKKYGLLFAVILVLMLLVIRMSGIFGVRPAMLEEEARFSHSIEDTWLCATSEPTDQMAAMLFYSPERDDFTYSIYVNRPGLSFGWFFRGGGSTVEVEANIAEYTVEGYTSRAYVSMNTQRIKRVLFGNDTMLELDPDKPFALVVSPELGSVQFCTEDGEWVQAVSHPL